MLISIVTIFPGYFAGPLSHGVVGRAIDAGTVQVDVHDLRTHGLGAHRQVDDTPYGGGAGLVMRVEPIADTLRPLADSHRVLMSAAGMPLDQATVDRFGGIDHLTLVCGRYEGVDERVAEHLVDEEVSVGDFVMAGGEAAALVIVEAVARLVPGVVGNPESIERESFRGGLLEEPVYTKPATYQGWEVPEVLRSGDHGEIERWRSEQRRRRTRERRPDLWASRQETPETGA